MNDLPNSSWPLLTHNLSSADDTSLSNNAMQAAPSENDSSMAPPCIETHMSADKKAGSPEKAIRNLTQAFEAICKDEKTPNTVISPTGVADVPLVTPASPSPVTVDSDGLPCFVMHPVLQRDLSDPLVQRVSHYSLIHDINKEAAALYAMDPLYHNQTPKEGAPALSTESPLIEAVLGTDSEKKDEPREVPVTTVAIIDEEEWLLAAIAKRSTEETAASSVSQCPATFLQAMGEKEYENPVHAVTGHARTQLWKPSRSWWEAKSGKNPWIEPASHNKRWRYLWPLIHYHKFLAKCIKKLKRNGVDVKQSVSNVAVFLREEVCAVSDHLASVSLFGSDEWMACLIHFTGWIVMSDDAETAYRRWVGEQPLRSIQEPGDINSPLLRSQIDETFLRTLIAQREQMRETMATKKSKTEEASNVPVRPEGQPPVYPRRGGAQVPKHIHGVRRPRYFGWWNGTNWEQTPPPPGIYADNSSVQSALSTDSHHRVPTPYDYGMYPMQPFPYPPQHPPYPTSGSDSYSTGYDSYNHSMYSQNAMYYPVHHDGGYYPQAMSPGYYHQPVAESPQDDKIPNTPQDGADVIARQEAQQSSPYWAHLDKATISMGLATPAKTSPTTPRRKGEEENFESVAPLVRQHYYPQYATQDPYAPPSPATQFMMSPQANFAYKYGYGSSGTSSTSSSPHRTRGTPRGKKMLSPVPARDSPATVSTETESIPDNSS